MTETSPGTGTRGLAPAPGKKKSNGLFAVVMVVWVIALGLCWGLLLEYSAVSGTPAAAPSMWPAAADFEFDRRSHRLVMVAHPHCSCTRASIAELSRLMTRLQGLVQGHVIFVVPEGLEQDWEQTDLWRSAAIIDGVQVYKDPKGALADAFGSFTSGQTLLYSASGELLFAGGLTAMRSHEGKSVGRERIIDIVTAGSSDGTDSAVYGCALRELDEDRARSTLERFEFEGLFGNE